MSEMTTQVARYDLDCFDCDADECQARIAGCNDGDFVLHSDYEAIAARLEALEAMRELVIGWREKDWPEGFSRATAETIASEACVILDAAQEVE